MKAAASMVAGAALVLSAASGAIPAHAAGTSAVDRRILPEGDWYAEGYLPQHNLSLSVGAQARRAVVRQIADGIFKAARPGKYTMTHDRVGTGAVPPAAQALADRLGMKGAPFLGNQPHSIGGPWAIWLHLIRSQPNSSRPTDPDPNGRALSAGPLGARGKFDYYDMGATIEETTYRGHSLSRDKAIRIARAWLRRVGAPIPPGTPGITWSHTTVVGGTGLCCFTFLAVVHWGGTLDAPGIVFGASATVYVADAGRVVQADVAPKAGRAPGQQCRYHIHQDSNGVPVGSSMCIDYGGAAASTMTIEIGGHEPWRADPREVAQVFANATKLAASERFSLHVVRETAEKAIYTVSRHGVTYRLTLIAAFPGLPGGIWQIADVERV